MAPRVASWWTQDQRPFNPSKRDADVYRASSVTGRGYARSIYWIRRSTISTWAINVCISAIRTSNTLCSRLRPTKSCTRDYPQGSIEALAHLPVGMTFRSNRGYSLVVSRRCVRRAKDEPMSSYATYVIPHQPVRRNLTMTWLRVLVRSKDQALDLSARLERA